MDYGLLRGGTASCATTRNHKHNEARPEPSRRRLPEHVLVVAIRRLLSHCPKCMVRSGLWWLDTWPDTTGLPSFADMPVAHGKLAETGEEMQAIVESGKRDRPD